LITFSFSEAITGFDLADLAVSGGTLGAITQSDATHYTATFTPTVGATAATIQVLASGSGTSSWSDAAGNAGTASNTFAISENVPTSATIANGGSLELNAASGETVTFTGGTGSLVLDQPAGFTGHIVGFTGTAPDAAHSDTIDLVGIDFNSV